MRRRGLKSKAPLVSPWVGLGFAVKTGTADVEASPKRWLPNLA